MIDRSEVASSPLAAPAAPASHPPARVRVVRWLLVAGFAVAVIGPLGRWMYLWVQDRQLQGYRDGAHAAREAKDWDQVAALAAKWAQREPDNAMPLLMLAEAAQEKGDLQTAADFLGQLPAGDLHTVPGLLERTNLLFGPLNQPFEGADTCKRIIAQAPDSFDAQEAWRRLVFFYAASVQRIELARASREAIRHGAATSETYIYLFNADVITLSNGYELTNRWLENTPENETILVARAMHFIYSAGLQEKVFAGEIAPEDDPSGKEGAYHERVLARYFEQFPRNRELLNYYLEKASTNGETEKVSKLLAQAPPEAADDGRFWRFQGWLHEATGDPSRADHAYRKALELNPFDWKSRHQLSGVLREAGQLDQAGKFAAVAAEGKELRKAIYQLDTVQSASLELLKRMARYAERCGETQIAVALARFVPTAGVLPGGQFHSPHAAR